MADSAKDEPRRRRAVAGGGVAVADDGDISFGAMAGAGILAAILVAFFISAGIIDYNPEPVAVAVAEADGDHTNETDGEEEERDATIDADAFQISSDLAAAGYSVQLSANGNTVTVRGPVADETMRAEIIAFVQDQPNVEQVVDETIIPEPLENAADATINVSDESIILDGTVPSEEMAASIRAAAADAYSPDQITDELTVLEDATTYSITSTGALTDPLRYQRLTQALALASSSGALDGSYEGGVALDAEVDTSLNQLVELEPILFQTGTADIDPASQPTLERAVEILRLFPDVKVEIGGHTDSTGDPALNQDLSQRRAQAVLVALVAGGVESELTAVGYGPDQPLADNATPEGRAQNRRIEFTAL